VPEAVVVSLEPVQVEDHQEGEGGVFRREPFVEVGDQLSAVRKPRQRVRDGLVLRQVEEAPVVAEADDEAHDDE
jgi:hypothetical protein